MDELVARMIDGFGARASGPMTMRLARLSGVGAVRATGESR